MSFIYNFRLRVFETQSGNKWFDSAQTPRVEIVMASLLIDWRLPTHINNILSHSHHTLKDIHKFKWKTVTILAHILYTKFISYEIFTLINICSLTRRVNSESVYIQSCKEINHLVKCTKYNCDEITVLPLIDGHISTLVKTASVLETACKLEAARLFFNNFFQSINFIFSIIFRTIRENS
jgi:hypothetical protein